MVFRSKLQGLAMLSALAMIAGGCAQSGSPGSADNEATSGGADEQAEGPASDSAADDTTDTSALEEFYSGETLTIMTTHSPGSTADVHSRALAEHIGQYIPGNPDVRVENMTGGGQNIGVQWLHDTAESDGLTIGTFSSHRIVASILGEEGVNYDVRDLTWLGTTTAAPSICGAWHEAGIESVEDLENGEATWTLGARAPSDVTHIVATMMQQDLRWDNVEVVLGYDGMGETTLAMEQGELTGACHPYASIFGQRPEYEEDNLFVPLFVVGPQPSPNLPDLPVVTDLPWSENYKAGLNAYVQRFQLLVPVAAPPGLPEVRREVLREALTKTVNDEAWVTTLEKMGQRSENPSTGQEVEKIVAEMYATPDEAWQTVVAAQQDG